MVLAFGIAGVELNVILNLIQDPSVDADNQMVRYRRFKRNDNDEA